ncbi:hypothetical protein A8F94_07255 [Bacillus sp. FJAT-27225]|uniref:hypothetical protein n=1 Tax=Bacillus sp. FJAT-27225 TaxID=1743144 RepID=UPI00080C31C7|nr:hypothetical protein [Bacillus sp. FJAT-27225]OCA87647.1 hypothetical protein A8F94_07255 [Bacillus sp. FJAT-27225]
MDRSFERKIIYIASGWQIVTGMITMFFYSMYVKQQGANLEHLQIPEQMGVQSLFDSMFTYTVTYGLFFVIIGVLNVIFAKRILKDDTLQHKLPLYWILLAIVCYFLSDYISLAFLMMGAVIALAKNKPIQAYRANQK